MQHNWSNALKVRAAACRERRQSRLEDSAGFCRQRSASLGPCALAGSPSKDLPILLASRPKPREQDVSKPMKLSPSPHGRSLSSPDLKAQATFPRSSRPLSRQLEGCVQRQFQHASIERRRERATLQRQLLEEDRMANIHHYGGAAGFRKYLKQHFGSTLLGWRAIDTEEKGKLSFYEFCNACRRLSCGGNLQKLWSELDHDNAGSVDYSKIDPEVARQIGVFRLALTEKYGSDLLRAWHTALDVNKKGLVSSDELANVCRKLGLDDEHVRGEILFRAYVGTSRTQMALKDFDPSTDFRVKGGRLHGDATSPVKMNVKMDSPSRRGSKEPPSLQVSKQSPPKQSPTRTGSKQSNHHARRSRPATAPVKT
eukprot:TRINITY_DN12715_c0_g2_i1.p1 TRINITY_DN12715_c0_g2~~TRINITY_DN12715_c0_g2_i1.p1  ORF type:complete len:369 (-),score=41.43 TRINITY_DN12715_c0_g2_i1:337-1443(-)